jgi:(p)ppGpp synthase/HD superfamily hydrolase
MLGPAIAIAAEAFKDHNDKGGTPYIMHCLTVMNAMPKDDTELMIVAVLHDLIEDTHWTTQMLRDLGFSERVLSALELLTHDPKVPYEDYIKAIALSKDAKRVKMADLRHNSDILRMKGLRKKDFDRLEKYHRSFMYLKE